MNYKKVYIGKGTSVTGMDIVKVTLKVEELLQVTHKYEGVEYLSFEIAKMKASDEFGRTHTCYVSVREKAEEKPAPEPKAKGRKPKKEEPVMETENSELPF